MDTIADYTLVIFLPWALLSLAGLIVPFGPFVTRFQAFAFLCTSCVAVAFAMALSEGDLRVASAERVKVEWTAAATSEPNPRPAAATAVSTLDHDLAAIRRLIVAGDWAGAEARYREALARRGDMAALRAELEGAALAAIQPASGGATATLRVPALDFLALIGADATAAPTGLNATAAFTEVAAAMRAAIAPLDLRGFHDPRRGITWRLPETAPQVSDPRSTVFLYVGEQAGHVWLRMRTQYAGERMLYPDRVTALADGEAYTLTSGRFTRGARSLSWVWADERPSARQLAILRALAEAGEAALRFDGGVDAIDVPLGEDDKRALHAILDAAAAATPDQVAIGLD